MTDPASTPVRTCVDRFSQQLTGLQTALEEAAIAADLQSQALSLQQQFQRILTSVAETTFPPEVEPQLRPCLTEMNRLVRLIGLDAIFLRTARQTQTVQSRQAQMGKRLEQLQALCQAVQTALS